MAERIVVNHLTRMREGHICVAGLGPDGSHVRPQRRHGRWTREHLHPRGVFEVGAVVELGEVQPDGSPPEVEDVIVLDDGSLRRRRRLSDDAFWERLTLQSFESLRDIFGEELERYQSGTASVPEHAGGASLGCVRADRAELVVDGDRPRIEFHDPDLGTLNLSVTDVRVCDHEHRPVKQLLGVVGRRLARGEDVVLAVGLSRAMAAGSAPPAHWLQVNNLHFVDYFDDHPAFAPYRPS